MKSRKVNLTRSPEEELRSRVHVHLDQDGGNPSQLLEMIALIVQDEIWKKFGSSFRQFIELPYEDGGLGWSVENLKSLNLRHRFEHKNSSRTEVQEQLKEMRQRVDKLLNEQPLNGNGGDRKSALYYNTDLPPSPQQGTSSDYTIRRLKRDRPDLAQRVFAGELSRNAAAIEAGFREAPLQMSPKPAAAGRYLAKHVDREWIEEMVEEYFRVKNGNEE